MLAPQTVGHPRWGVAAQQPRVLSCSRRQRGAQVVLNVGGSAPCTNAIHSTRHKYWSNWYAPIHEPWVYRKYVEQDYWIREKVNKDLRNANVTHVYIERQSHMLSNVQVEVHVIRPELIDYEFLQRVQGELEKEFDIKCGLKLTEASYKSPAVVAHQLASKLEAREVRLNQAISQTLKWCKDVAKIENLKIQVKGRLDGVEIARKRIDEYGSIPYSTFECVVDFYQKTAHTKYGALGVKVWVYNGKPRRQVLEELGLPQLDGMMPGQKKRAPSLQINANSDEEFEYQEDLDMEAALDESARKIKLLPRYKRPGRYPKGYYKHMVHYLRNWCDRSKVRVRKAASRTKGMTKFRLRRQIGPQRRGYEVTASN